MKVIRTDNFDRGNISDALIESDLTRQDANSLANKLNEPLGEKSPYWHIEVEDNYKLFVRTN